MNRFTEEIVLCGFVMAWRLAGSPTFLSPFFKKATTDGVVRLPSSLAITTGSLPSITATQLFVVPKSIPIILTILFMIFVQFPIDNDCAERDKVKFCHTRS